MFYPRRYCTQLWARCRSVLAPPAKHPGESTLLSSAAPAPDDFWPDGAVCQEILQHQSDLVCACRADTQIQYVNPAFCDYFGIAPPAVLNQPWQSMVWESDRAAVAEQVAALTCQHPSTTLKHRVVVQGAVRWMQWNIRCLWEPDGAIASYWLIGRDVTEQKRSEAALHQSQAHYAALMQAIPELVWVAEADGVNWVEVNQQWAEFTGLSVNALVGRGWLECVHGDDVEGLLAAWHGAIAHHQRYSAEYRLRRADGAYVWHLAQANPVLDDTGTLHTWYGTCRDISDRKHMEHQQRVAEIALQRLNNTLERQVEQRTQALRAANEALRQEIANRCQVQMQLSESEQRFRRAIVEAPFPIIIHAEDGRILQTSQAVTNITGYRAAEMPTLEDWTRLAYGERQSSVLESIYQLYQRDRRVDEGNFEVQTRRGDKRIWYFSSAPLGRLTDGTRLTISMAADLTRQKQAEVALADRLRQQAAVARLSQTALSGLNLQGLFDQATRLVHDSLNVEYTKVLQLLPDGQWLRVEAGVGWQPDIVGKATVDTQTNSQAGYTLKVQKPVVVQDLTTETRFQGPKLLADHGVISGMSTLIMGVNDRPFGVLGAHSTRHRSFTQDDVNFLQAVANLLATAIKRKHTEDALSHLNQTLEERIRDRTQALEEVNQELQSFSYSVAHDLRAPLRSIQGFAHVLNEDYAAELDDLGKDYINRMATSAEYLDGLIQDLLAYSQLGRTEIVLGRVDLNDLLTQVIDSMHLRLEQTQAQINIAPDLPTVIAQRSILRQVLSNLIDNALKFVAPDVTPKIQIWADIQSALSYHLPRRDRRIKLWIQDNGIGISPRHQTRIFRPFERLHSTEVYPGTGIGLSIVQRGIHRMGGNIGIVSDEHLGSQFWIELTAGPSPLNTNSLNFDDTFLRAHPPNLP